VLSVAVDLNDRVMAVGDGVSEPAAQGPSNAEVDRKSKNHRACGLGDRSGLVVRAVIDDQDGIAEMTSALDDRSNAVLFV
jgi:hypothetical protein